MVSHTRKFSPDERLFNRCPTVKVPLRREKNKTEEKIEIVQQTAHAAQLTFNVLAHRAAASLHNGLDLDLSHKGAQHADHQTTALARTAFDRSPGPTSTTAKSGLSSPCDIPIGHIHWP